MSLDLAQGELWTVSLAKAIEEAQSILSEARARYQPVKTFALVSGGHDSATMLHLARGYVDAAVHIETGIGIPETSQFVRDLCTDLGIQLLTYVTPPDVYRDIVLGPSRKGFPGPGLHYVTYHRLKSQRLQELQRDHAGRGERLLLVSGVRSSESRRRMRQVGAVRHEAPRGRLGKCAWANPIVHFTRRLLDEYRSAYDLPSNPVVDHLHRSGECLCGAFAHPGELEEIAFFYPETAQCIRDLESEAAQLGKRYAKWGPGQGQGQGSDARGRDLKLCQDCSLFSESL